MRKVNFISHVVGFLDILGFKDFIKRAEIKGTTEFSQFRQLLNVISQQLDFTSENPQEQHLFPKDVCLSMFHISDSFVLSAPVVNEKRPGYSGLVAVSIKAIQLAHQLLMMGFLVRGGIAVGNVYRTRHNIFGSGYQAAFETENCADAPRVLLHKSAVDLFEAGHHNGYPLKFLSIFLKEQEDIIVNSFHPHWSYVGGDRLCNITRVFEIYRNTIQENLLNLTIYKARQKWEWAANLFNNNQKYFSDLRNVSSIDLQNYQSSIFYPVITPPQTTFEEAFGGFMAPPMFVRSFGHIGTSKNET
jgi:hypothetical protein